MRSDILWQTRSIKNATDSVKAHQPNPHAAAVGGMDFGDLPPETQQGFLEHAATRKAKWYDQEIPILGNLTPRQAARSEEGRRRLEELIADYNYSRQQSTGNSLMNLLNPTEDEIRKELGL